MCEFATLPAYMELYSQLSRAEASTRVALSVSADGTPTDKCTALVTAALQATSVLVAGLQGKVRQ